MRQVLLILCIVVGLPACTAGNGELWGEWTLEVMGSGAESASGGVRGIVVFHPKITSYGPSTDPSVLTGRIYIDWRALLPGEERPATDYHYLTGEAADFYEEIDAFVLNGGDIHLVVAPQVFGHDPEFYGTFDVDGMVGTWVYLSHSDTVASGSFRMMRSRRTAATDSAISRSHRAADRWSASAR